jgi:hypothetical protein
MKPINTLCGQNSKLFNVRLIASSTYNNHMIWDYFQDITVYVYEHTLVNNINYLEVFMILHWISIYDPAFHLCSYIASVYNDPVLYQYIWSYISLVYVLYPTCYTRQGGSCVCACVCVCVRARVSVCLSVRMFKLKDRWKDFYEIVY